jgi:hypothetical protein
MSLKEFIVSLQEMVQNKSSMIIIIKYPKMLFEALEDLDKMVGMLEVKNNIIKLVKKLMIGTMRQAKPKRNDRLLHIMLMGDPGTGKTDLGLILCKIYTSLNLLNKPEVMPPTGDDEEEDNKNPCKRPRVVTTASPQNHINMQMREELRITKNKLTEVNHKIRKHRDKSAVLLRDLNEYKRGRPYYTNYFINAVAEVEIGLNEVLKTSTIIVPPPMPSFPLVLPPIVVEEPKPIYVVCSRADLVAKYTGQSAIKTRKLLNSAMGGVCFIDEAYDLLHTDSAGDGYGNEILTVIVDYQSKYNDNIAIIFAGYEKKIKETILDGQEGLKSRIGYTFIMKSYTIPELVQIFQIQLERNIWTTSCTTEQLIDLFTKYKKVIINGRDTQNLVSKCIDAHATICFGLVLKSENFSFSIDEIMLKNGLEEMKTMSAKLKKEERSPSPPPHGMYT